MKKTILSNMKNLYLSLIFILINISLAKAQVDAAVNVEAIGIGASDPSPSYKFTYDNKPVGHYGLGWYNDSQYGPMAYLSGYNGIKFFTGGNFRGVIDGNGNVGIGTNTPTTPLSIVNATPVILVSSSTGNPGNGSIMGRLSFGTAYGEFAAVEGARIPGAADDISVLRFKTSYSVNAGGDGNNIERMRINFNGNVGIGTTSPDAKLTVDGTIHSKEVKVDVNIAPDYVFEKDYKLKTLKEVQDYIAENKHLPEIPSAKNMEQNGVDLSEMNMKLLKKVEELTLYLIQKDEQLKEQQIKAQKQDKRITALEKALKRE